MSAPYQSPADVSSASVAAPWWYVMFYRLYWPVWFAGTALIVASWFQLVAPTVGWVGFSMAGAAALGSYVLPSWVVQPHVEFVVLNSRQLYEKTDGYQQAMQRFANGESLVYDGVAFGIRPNHEIACAVAANTTDLSDAQAHDIAAYAKEVFDELASQSAEFAAAVRGRTFRVSIWSSFEPNGRELCRVVGGEISWCS